MSHTILVNGKRLEPKDARKILMPSDTLLVCPHCESRMVQAVPPKLTARFVDETHLTVPRLQDRWCLDCGYRWATVLPPEFQARAIPQQ